MRIRVQQAKEQAMPPEVASLVQDGDGYNYIIQTEAEVNETEVWNILIWTVVWKELFNGAVV